MRFRSSLLVIALGFAAVASAQYPILVAYDVDVGTYDSELVGVSAADMIGHSKASNGAIYQVFRRTTPTSPPWTLGGAVLGSTDGVQVTGRYQSIAGFVIFNGNPFFQQLPAVSGYSTGFAADSYGSRFGGTAYNVNGPYRAVLWPGYSGTPRVLHPAGMSNSYVTGVSIDREVGWVSGPGIVRNAATWQGTAASFRNLHPAGHIRSEINGIYSSFGVGTLTDNANVVHAATFELVGGASWYIGGPAPNYGLARDEEMVVGYTTASGSQRALLWNLNYGGSTFDLHNVLGSSYSTSVATCVDRNGPGLWIGGYARHIPTGRNHAVVWMVPPA